MLLALKPPLTCCGKGYRGVAVWETGERGSEGAQAKCCRALLSPLLWTLVDEVEAPHVQMRCDGVVYIPLSCICGEDFKVKTKNIVFFTYVGALFGLGLPTCLLGLHQDVESSIWC